MSGRDSEVLQEPTRQELEDDPNYQTPRQVAEQDRARRNAEARALQIRQRWIDGDDDPLSVDGQLQQGESAIVDGAQASEAQRARGRADARARRADESSGNEGRRRARQIGNNIPQVEKLPLDQLFGLPVDDGIKLIREYRFRITSLEELIKVLNYLPAKNRSINRSQLSVIPFMLDCKGYRNACNLIYFRLKNYNLSVDNDALTTDGGLWNTKMFSDLIKDSNRIWGDFVDKSVELFESIMFRFNMEAGADAITSRATGNELLRYPRHRRYRDFKALPEGMTWENFDEIGKKIHEAKVKKANMRHAQRSGQASGSRLSAEDEHDEFLQGSFDFQDNGHDQFRFVQSSGSVDNADDGPSQTEESDNVVVTINRDQMVPLPVFGTIDTDTKLSVVTRVSGCMGDLDERFATYLKQNMSLVFREVHQDQLTDIWGIYARSDDGLTFHEFNLNISGIIEIIGPLVQGKVEGFANFNCSNATLLINDIVKDSLLMKALCEWHQQGKPYLISEAGEELLDSFELSSTIWNFNGDLAQSDETINLNDPSTGSGNGQTQGSGGLVTTLISTVGVASTGGPVDSSVDSFLNPDVSSTSNNSSAVVSGSLSAQVAITNSIIPNASVIALAAPVPVPVNPLSGSDLLAAASLSASEHTRTFHSNLQQFLNTQLLDLATKMQAPLQVARDEREKNYQRQKEVDDLQETIASKKQEVLSLDGFLTQQKGELSTLQKSILLSKECIRKVAEDLKIEQSNVETIQATLVLKQTERVTLEGILEAKRIEFSNLEERIQTLRSEEGQIQAREQAVGQRESTFLGREQAVVRQQSELQAREQALVQRESAFQASEETFKTEQEALKVESEELRRNVRTVCAAQLLQEAKGKDINERAMKIEQKEAQLLERETAIAEREARLARTHTLPHSNTVESLFLQARGGAIPGLGASDEGVPLGSRSIQSLFSIVQNEMRDIQSRGAAASGAAVSDPSGAAASGAAVSDPSGAAAVSGAAVSASGESLSLSSDHAGAVDTVGPADGA